MNRVTIRVIAAGMAIISAALLPLQGFAGGPVLRPAVPGVQRIVPDTSLPFVRHNNESRAASMVWFHLACFSARMKMYPLAMKLFLKSARGKHGKIAADSGIDSVAANGWHFTHQEDSLITLPENYVVDSKMLALSEVLADFRDTADAEQYAVVLLVKQPVFNKRKVFTGIGNVGHTFISLIRFNRDNTYVSRTFGFYPRKRYPLAASPLFPLVPGMFRDDRDHDWDEMAGRFISKTQFSAIIRSMESYAGRRYHLSKNNCTDFGLRIAALGGINVSETASHWPLGKGNNPAWTGQSLLSGHLCNADSLPTGDIFLALHHPEALGPAGLQH